MTKLAFISLGFILATISSESLAKNRFYTYRDVNCDTENFCVMKTTQSPLNGELKVFYEDGRLKMFAEYRNGKTDGRYVDFYDEGKMRSSRNYRNGLEYGNSKVFYPNGNLMEEHEMTAGKRDGVSRKFYPNGQVKREVSYQNGVKNGSENGYYEDGDLYYRLSYVNGKVVSGYCQNKERKRFNFDAETYAAQGLLPCY